MKVRWLSAALVLVCAASAGAQQRRPAASGERPAAVRPPTAPPVEVRTWVSRTAVWVGDKVEYVIELRRAPNVEVFLDDLAPERLRIDGLEVLDTATEKDVSQTDRIVDRMRYTLATYNAEAEALTIGAIPVRYSIRRPGQRAEEALPAGEVTVPPLHLALRSTITASGDAIVIRDQRAVRPLPRRMRLAETVGWTLLAIAVLPVVLWAARMVQMARRRRPRRPSRPPVRRRRAALEEIKEADVSTPAARRDAYARLDAWVRENLHLEGGAPASALTPEELAAALGQTKTAEWRMDLERVLLECERAKYEADPPPDNRWPAVVEETAQLTLA
ncbi:MAG: hypothetical protein ABIS06_07605 [Vicinamibacterales bacterium]